MINLVISYTFAFGLGFIVAWYIRTKYLNHWWLKKYEIDYRKDIAGYNVIRTKPKNDKIFEALKLTKEALLEEARFNVKSECNDNNSKT